MQPFPPMPPKPLLPGFDYTPPSYTSGCPSCCGSPAGAGMLFGVGQLITGIEVPCDTNGATIDLAPFRQTQTRRLPDTPHDADVQTDDFELFDPLADDDEPVQVSAATRARMRRIENEPDLSGHNSMMLVSGEGLESSKNGVYGIRLYNYIIKRGYGLDRSGDTDEIHVLESGRYRVTFSARFVAEYPDSAHDVSSQLELRSRFGGTIRALRAESFDGTHESEDIFMDLTNGDSLSLHWRLNNAEQLTGITDIVIMLEKA